MSTSLKNQRGGFGLGLVVGLLLGLAVALAVALYVTKTPVPLMNKAQQASPEQDAAEVERNKTWDPNAALAGKQAMRPPAPAAPDAATAQATAPAAAGSDTAVVPRAVSTAPGVVLPTPADNGRVTPAPTSPAGTIPPAPANLATPTTPRAAASGSTRSARDAAAILNGQASIGDGSGVDPAAAKAAATAGTDPFIYFVQVGAYSREEDADQQRAKLALAGLRATVSDREQNGRTVHRVRLGPFDRKDDADAQVEHARSIDPEAALVRVERAPKQ